MRVESRDCLSRLGCRSGRSAFVTEFCTGRGCQSDRARETGQVRRPPSHGPPLSRGARPRRGVGLLTASEGGRTGRSALSRRARGRLDSASPGARAGAASSRLAPLGRRRALGRDVPQARPPAGVHEARLKQRPPAAVSCVERRAHVHGWSSDSAVVHEERERCLDSSCADEGHALGSCSHRRHTGRSGLV